MEITATTNKLFVEQFTQLLQSQEAIEKIGIVYLWKVLYPIPRLYGESQIIYIGQSKNSLNSRYLNSKSLSLESDYFNKYYKYMIEKYGAISIEIKSVSSPKYEEWRLLMEYNEKHKEYPPLNRSIPNKPKI